MEENRLSGSNESEANVDGIIEENYFKKERNKIHREKLHQVAEEQGGKKRRIELGNDDILQENETLGHMVNNKVNNNNENRDVVEKLGNLMKGKNNNNKSGKVKDGKKGKRGGKRVGITNGSRKINNGGKSNTEPLTKVKMMLEELTTEQGQDSINDGANELKEVQTGKWSTTLQRGKNFEKSLDTDDEDDSDQESDDTEGGGFQGEIDRNGGEYDYQDDVNVGEKEIVGMAAELIGEITGVETSIKMEASYGHDHWQVMMMGPTNVEGGDLRGDYNSFIKRVLISLSTKGVVMGMYNGQEAPDICLESVDGGWETPGGDLISIMKLLNLANKKETRVGMGQDGMWKTMTIESGIFVQVLQKVREWASLRVIRLRGIDNIPELGMVAAGVDDGEMDEEEIRGWEEIGRGHCVENGGHSYLRSETVNVSIRVKEGLFEVDVYGGIEEKENVFSTIFLHMIGRVSIIMRLLETHEVEEGSAVDVIMEWDGKYYSTPAGEIMGLKTITVYSKHDRVGVGLMGGPVHGRIITVGKELWGKIDDELKLWCAGRAILTMEGKCGDVTYPWIKNSDMRKTEEEAKQRDGVREDEGILENGMGMEGKATIECGRRGDVNTKIIEVEGTAEDLSLAKEEVKQVGDEDRVTGYLDRGAGRDINGDGMVHVEKEVEKLMELEGRPLEADDKAFGSMSREDTSAKVDEDVEEGEELKRNIDVVNRAHGYETMKEGSEANGEKNKGSGLDIEDDKGLDDDEIREVIADDGGTVELKKGVALQVAESAIPRVDEPNGCNWNMEKIKDEAEAHIRKYGEETDEGWWIFNIETVSGIWGIEIKGAGVMRGSGIMEGLRTFAEEAEIFFTLRTMGSMDHGTGSPNITLVHETGGYAMRDMEWLKFKDLERGSTNEGYQVELIRDGKSGVFIMGGELIGKLRDAVLTWGMARIMRMERKDDSTGLALEKLCEDEKTQEKMEWENEEDDYGRLIKTETWVQWQVKCSRRWSAKVVSRRTGRIHKWNDRTRTVREAIEEGEKGSFWMAIFGDYYLVAAEEGTEQEQKLVKTMEHLEREEDDLLEMQEGIRVVGGEMGKRAWEQEVVNILWCGGIEGRIINQITYGDEGGRYGVVIHRTRGVITPPDEIEMRRRELVEAPRMDASIKWEFTKYEEWVVAVCEERTAGNWAAYDKISKELGDTVIGPMTTEFGNGVRMDNGKGMELLESIMEDGTISNKGEHIEMDETVVFTAIGAEARDGVLIGEARFRLNERWATEEELRTEQLRQCVRVKMKMYRIKGPANTVKGENIDIDFSGNEGDTWVRRTRDKAGEEWMNTDQLNKIVEKGCVVVGYRVDDTVRKMKIGTTSFADLLGQIGKKCMEWGRSIHVWTAETSIWMDSTQQDEAIMKSGEDEQFEANGAFVYGISREMLDRIPQDDLALMIADVAKTGIRGINTKFQELKKSLESEHFFTLAGMGLAGGRNGKSGVLVEFRSKVKAGLSEGRGIMINEWRNYRKEKTQSHPEVRAQMTRQLLSSAEVKMIKKGMEGRQDFLVVAARGLMRIGGIDDVMRRSFKNYLEEELKINVFVWITTIRHTDDRGAIRDEPIMMGLVSEGGGEKLSARIQTVVNSKKKGMMMLEGVEIQLFRDINSIWNTSKPGLVGSVDRYIEMVCPRECDRSEVTEVAMEMGIIKICMMAKTTKKGGKMDEIWTIVPAKGEKLRVKGVVKGDRHWDAHEYVRVKETDRCEAGQISWTAGIKKTVEQKQRDDVEMSSLSSVTSGGTTAESVVTRATLRMEDNAHITALGVIENKMLKEREEDRALQRELIAREREKTDEGMDRLRRDVLEVMKAGRDELKEEERRRRQEEDDRWEKKMAEMMGIIGKMDFNKKN
jgi:hypothetical protein